MAFTQQQHPRFSTEHLSPTNSSSTRFSLPSAPSIVTTLNVSRPSGTRPNIYDRNLNKTRTAEVSASAFSFLFSEVVQYTQKRVSGINDLERRLNTLGYRIGVRVLELMVWRAESSSKAPKREIRFLPALMSIHTQVWRAVYGKPADAIEKSVENDDEYMIIDNDPPIERHISVPRDMSQLSCSSFTAGIVEAVLDGLGLVGAHLLILARPNPAPACPRDCPQHSHAAVSVSDHNSHKTRKVTGVIPGSLIFIRVAAALQDSAFRRNYLKFISNLGTPSLMVDIHTISVAPPLINTSCAWASELIQLERLYRCAFTGAVTTRTATLNGFPEDASHTVAFAKNSVTTLNSYGYSPRPLAVYLEWVSSIIKNDPTSVKPFIISITSSSPSSLRTMLTAIQDLRKSLGVHGIPSFRIAVELNTSCPNIVSSPPPAYNFASLAPLLDILAEQFWQDTTLTLGLKLPPYVYSTQFDDVLAGVAAFSRTAAPGERSRNPFAFFTCTNTLGASLLFADQITGPGAGAGGAFAVPTATGGLAGEPLHALALGNVYSFTRLLAASPDEALHDIIVIGVGGVTTPAAVERMRRAGARVVGCATLLGREGVDAFERLSV